VRAEGSKPLGVKPSARRAAEMTAGAVVGFALAAWPWVGALVTGRAGVRDGVGAHFGGLDAARVVSTGVSLLLLSAFTEEVANRAFPMRLWQNRSLAFRVVVPSLFFAAVHFAGEPFGVERAVTLLAAGVTQSLAYAMTGDVWLASGLHFGANYAGFSASGLWHAGAVAEVFGRAVAPNWVSSALMLVTVAAAFAVSERFYDSDKNHPRAARREA
jgi:membrane protease YdiL (CAAX protease family)